MSGSSGIGPPLRSAGSERNVVVEIAAAAARQGRAALRRRGAAEGLRTLLAKTLATFAAAARIEQRQFAAETLQDDFGDVTLGAGLIVVLARLDLPFEIDLRALLAILLDDTADVLVINHDVVPLGLFLALAGVLVLPRFRGGEG